MIEFRLNKTVFFILIVALLSMQWSTAHIHLAEHHDHNGSHHQHKLESHAHQSFTQHDSLVDSIQKINDHEVNLVELDNDCNIHKWNNFEDQALALNFTTIQLDVILQSDSVATSNFHTSKRRYIDYSSINLRAPPKLS